MLVPIENITFLEKRRIWTKRCKRWTHCGKDDKEEVPDTNDVDAGNIGKRIIGHWMNLPATFRVDPVKKLDLGRVGSLVVTLEQLN